MTRSRDLTSLLLALGVLGLAACTSGAPNEDVACEPHGTRLHIAVLATQTHTFTTDCLAAPGEQPFTIEFDNQDTSAHGNPNIHIYDSPKDFHRQVGDPWTQHHVLRAPPCRRLVSVQMRRASDPS